LFPPFKSYVIVLSIAFLLSNIRRRQDNRIGHIPHRNCLHKHVTKGKREGRIQVKGRRGRRRKQLLDDLEKTNIPEIERKKY
jgi:hypothetical protein